jgi:hypothetical protein
LRTLSQSCAFTDLTKLRITALFVSDIEMRLDVCYWPTFPRL